MNNMTELIVDIVSKGYRIDFSKGIHPDSMWVIVTKNTGDSILKQTQIVSLKDGLLEDSITMALCKCVNDIEKLLNKENKHE